MAARAQFPEWLHDVAIVSLTIAVMCAVIIAVDLLRRPQRMWIMNVVWPLTALFGSVIWLAVYWTWGRASPGQDDSNEPPFPVMVIKGASHCGAGCTLGDLIAEWIAVAVPAVAVWFGLGTLFSHEIFAIWVFDFVLAFLLGVGFQYFTIKPMRDLSVGRGIVQAAKADIASISAWQVGMYGMMAVFQFAVFIPLYGGTAKADTVEFWLAMQVAMLAGFCTAYPVNWLLISKGVKEKM